MDISEFVQTTLKQIIRGVADAQTTAEELGATINPSYAITSGSKGSPREQTVEFDIAVTVREGSQSGAGLQVGIPFVGGGVEGGSDRSRLAENRVRFTVPVKLPRQD